MKKLFKKLGIFSRKDLMCAYSNGFAHGQKSESISSSDNQKIKEASEQMKLFIDAYIKH